MVDLYFVEEPPNDPSNPPTKRLARFLGELGEHMGRQVPVLRGYLHDVAPAEGFVLLRAKNHPITSLEACTDEQRSSLLPRLVVIEVSPTRIFAEVLEPLSIPAAIDSSALFHWEGTEPSAMGGSGVRGRTEVGALVGATCRLWKSEHYCYLESPTHRGLPHLLVDYLAAYQRHVLAKR